MKTSLSRRELLGSLMLLPAAMRENDEWISLFDGHTLDGWTASGDKRSFQIVDGAILADGARSHLFYSGKVRDADFKNFELKADVLTYPGAQSGIYFHTKFSRNDRPEVGFKVQIDNAPGGTPNHDERRKTGSLFGVRNVFKAFVKDKEWFQLRVAVRARRVQIWLNGTILVDYVESEPPVTCGDMPISVLDRGTLALQCHDTNSKALFRNILIRPLHDDLLMPTGEPPFVNNVYRKLLWMNAHNFPVVDFHVHLKGGLTLEDALRESRRWGIMYGIAANCGLGFPITTDAAAGEFLDSMKGQPVFLAMQGEGREWVNLFSRKTIDRFDYVFTDAMTFTNDQGRRIRLWIKDEVGEISDPEQFMEMYVDRILQVLNKEPIDVYVNPTFLPEVIAREYDRLWTERRMQKVIHAAKANDVAIEINSRYRLPSPAFIKAAKKAGVKFSFGTNNSDRDLGRLEYPLEIVDECQLEWRDIFVPKALA